MAKTPRKSRGKHLGGKSLAAATTQCDRVRARIAKTRKVRGITAAQANRE